MNEWSIRSLFNPVITRLLVYGVNSIDIEYVISKVESMDHRTARSMEHAWVALWEEKADYYRTLAENASMRGKRESAEELYTRSTHCRHAIFMVNTASLEDKHTHYMKYAGTYAKTAEFRRTVIKRVDVPIGVDVSLVGYLHLPAAGTEVRKICAVILAGLGSCKEEMHSLVEPLLERGVSAFVPDMPGNGESLFTRKIGCSIASVEASFRAIVDTLLEEPLLNGYSFGTYGLCMGGGYSFRAASIDPRYAFCVALFPLLITKVLPDATPQWMKKAEWALFQRNNVTEEEFVDQMGRLEKGAINCPFFIVHSRHDNWMPFDRSLEFCHRAHGLSEQLLIEIEPVLFNGESITHAMPVGEQLHWVRHIAADLIADRAN